MSKTILIIDDDLKMIELLKDYLVQFGITLLSANRPSDGLKLVEEKNPRLVILDVMLPDKNGFEVCKDIRKISNVPVIMLTARGDVTDRIVGLELGADDYLAKPFDARELLARIQSVLRRTEETAKASKQLSFGDLEIHLAKRSAALKGQDLNLSTMEFDALLLLAQNAGQVLSRDQIMDRLRGIDWEAFNRSVDVLISRLRQKLHDDPKNPRYLKTVWGTGYLFIAEANE